MRTMKLEVRGQTPNDRQTKTEVERCYMKTRRRQQYRVCVCVYPSKRIHVAVRGPIGTKFGTPVQIHLEKVVVGKIKNLPRVTGIFTGSKIWKNYQTAGPIDTKFGTHVRIHLGMGIG